MSTMSGITTALVSGFTTMSSDAVSAIGSVVPYALPVMGAVVVISIAIKIFRKVAK